MGHARTHVQHPGGASHARLERPGASADLTSPDIPYLLDQLQLHPKFRGVYSDLPTDPGLHELARRDLTLDLPPRPGLIPPIADRYPTLRLVLDHVGRLSLMTQPFD